MRASKLMTGFVVVAAAAMVLTSCSSSGSSSTSTDASASAPAPTATPSISLPSTSTQLPSDWPAGVPSPEGLSLTLVIPSAGGGGHTAIYRGPGSRDAVAAQMISDLKKQGYVQNSSFGPPAIRWSGTEGATRVSLNITEAAGTVNCSVTATSI